MFSILHVEDDDLIVELFNRVLVKDLGPCCDILAVSSLADAKESVKNFNFDVIVLDLNLPDSKGSETLIQLGGLCPLIPIVVFTGEDSISLAVECIQKGAESFINKSELKKAPRTIRLALERYKYKQELRQKCCELDKNYKELERLSKLYYSIANSSPDWIVRLSPDGYITFVNDTACIAVGKKYFSIVGTHISEYLSNDAVLRTMDKIASLSMTSPMTSPVEEEVLGYWIEWRKIGIFDESGKLSEVQLIGRDVTDSRNEIVSFIEEAQKRIKVQEDRASGFRKEISQVLLSTKAALQGI